MLELLKTLLGIDVSDLSKDTILNFYLAKAKQSIITYKNKSYSDEVFEIDILGQRGEFSNQCVELAMYYYKNKDTAGLSSMAQGGRSISKEAYDLIPSYIKASLGLPFIKVGD
jgi:hypothetical protein